MSKRTRPSPKEVAAAMGLYRPADNSAPMKTVGGIRIPTGGTAESWAGNCRRMATACGTVNPAAADDWAGKAEAIEAALETRV